MKNILLQTLGYKLTIARVFLLIFHISRAVFSEYTKIVRICIIGITGDVGARGEI